MKIAIIGSREGFEEDFIYKKLDELILPAFENEISIRIITGGARGVDEDAEHWSQYRGVPIKIIRPINPANKLDYLFRNVEIITEADEIIAFWDGKSRGTKFVIDYATARDKDITVIKK